MLRLMLPSLSIVALLVSTVIPALADEPSAQETPAQERGTPAQERAGGQPEVSLSRGAVRISDSDRRFFELKVRPVLHAHCVTCHGPETQEGGLRLDEWSGMQRGGQSGKLLQPGQPDESLLMTAIEFSSEDLQMPPDEPLPERVVADLREWIRRGAPHPDAERTGPASVPAGGIDVDSAREFWSFQPPVRPELPAVPDRTWIRSPVDRFIRARLEQHGLHPAPRADRRVLIRRVTLDLLGVPPTAGEVEAFVADTRPDAWTRLIDRLLASPLYGERWGRHWLDVARYADSNGLDENIAHGNAWRYRDWVVDSFNADRPYDEFLLHQLAGDLLPASETRARYERLIATGYLSLGPKVLAEVDETKMEMDIIDEQIDTIGRSLMGLTLGCARCHDHKFDPITMRDYYGLAGIFKSTRTMEHFTKIARWWENPIPTAEEQKRLAAHTERVDALQASIDRVTQEQQSLQQDAQEPVGASGGTESTAVAEREARATQLAEELKQLKSKLGELEKNAPEVSTAMGVGEREATDVPIHVRGSHLTLGEVVPRHVPAVLTTGATPEFSDESSGRLQLARWLVQPDHPLTARVMVNRLWHWHFGRGLVPTPDNFGLLGEPPTHPELLDWLAVEFQSGGWSIKHLHRLILDSSTYQMASHSDDARAAEIDPGNRLWWRTDVRRLEAEAIRDSLLAVGCLLETQMGGSLLHVKNREFFFNHTSKDTTAYDSYRRSLYLPVVRNHLYDVFQLFDYADAAVSMGDRPTSTVAPQALFMLNSDLMSETCAALADSLLAQRDASDSDRIHTLYLRVYGRRPEGAELARAAAFLDRFSARLKSAEAPAAESERQAWRLLCQVLLSANEFIYLR